MKNEEEIIREVYEEILDDIDKKIKNLESEIEKFIKEEIKIRMENDIAYSLQEDTLSEKELLDKVFELESKKSDFNCKINLLKVRKMKVESDIAKKWEISEK